MKFRTLRPYRYQITDDCAVPVLSPDLLRALRDTETIRHPFFEITRRAVLVRAGYAWDGATGVIFQTENLRVPSLIHDIGCQAVNLGMLPRDFRAAFDAEYYAQALEYGALKARAMAHFAAIRLWGMIPKAETNPAPYADVKETRIRGVVKP